MKGISIQTRELKLMKFNRNYFFIPFLHTCKLGTRVTRREDSLTSQWIKIKDTK